MSKVQSENTKRLEILYNQSHNWLIAVSYNLSKDKNVADELVEKKPSLKSKKAVEEDVDDESDALSYFQKLAEN